MKAASEVLRKSKKRRLPFCNEEDVATLIKSKKMGYLKYLKDSAPENHSIYYKIGFCKKEEKEV